MLTRFNRWLHSFLAMLACLLLLFYGTTGFMLNHDNWFGKDYTELPGQRGSLPKDWVTPDDEDENAIVAELKTRHHLLGGYDGMETKKGKLRVSFSRLGRSEEADIDPETGTYDLSVSTWGWKSILMDLHKGKEGPEAWRRIMDAAAILLVLAALTGILMGLTMKHRRWLSIVSAGFCAAGVALVLFLWR
jgi:hypothetical protein